jgi:hypothetical protein
LLAASLLASAAMPVAGQAVFGIGAEDGCGGLVGNDTENAVLIGVKVPTSGSCTDILFDLSQVGGQVASGSTGLNPGDQWSISPNWRVPQVAADVHFIFLLYGPAAGTQANRIIMDSGTINDQFFGVAMRMTVGNSLPSSFDSAPGSNTKGIDLVLPTSGVNYSVRLSGGGAAAPPATTGFPRGANGGVEVAFAPLAEINQSEPVGGCALSGLNPMPNAPNNPALDGAIIGYNVYRLNGTAGSPPTAAAFYTASLNADPTDGWQYYMPLTQSYNLTTMDNLGLAGPTPPAASDMNPDDLGGLQNPDGINYTGDEVMIFQDSASNRGTGRATGSAPVVGQGYWYTFQPVMCGSITDFSAAMGWGSGNVFNGDHGNSASAAAAGDDSLDLDLDGTNEFFSPQADFGLPGLGFMYNGALFMTQPVFGQIDPAPAAGGLVLTGSLSGQSVNLQFQTTLESGNVTSFKVYRGAGSSRVLVGQPIAAQGTESSLYQLVDDAVQARRVSRGGAVEYTVDVVYDDGHTSTVGPFSVTLDRATGGGRRTR